MGAHNWEDPQEIIKGIRAGNNADISKLISAFRPLVLSVANTLCCRYQGLIPIEDLIKDGIHLLVYIAACEYKSDGKARFPYFLKTHLHARLVQIYQPIARYRIRATDIDWGEHAEALSSVIDELFANERLEVMEKLNAFITLQFNERERALINDFICGTTSRAQLAKKFGVSPVRMKAIYNKCIDKAYKFLKSLDIRSMKDI